MKKQLVYALAVSFLFLACAKKPQLQSGVYHTEFDQSVRPADDFYMHVNGNWVKNTEIPATETGAGSFLLLRDTSQARLKKLIETVASANNTPGTDGQKVGDYFSSYMDTIAIETAGITPLNDYINQINAVKSTDDLMKLAGQFQKLGIGGAFGSYVYINDKNSSEYITSVTQGGLGLPDRDYYLEKNPKFDGFRTEYVKYLEELFTLIGDTKAKEKAAKIMALETKIAKIQWSRAELRDDNKAYNKFSTDDFAKKISKINIKLYLTEAGLNVDTIIVRQPTFFTKLDSMYKMVSLDDWKSIFTFNLVRGNAGILSSQFVNANFNFYGKTLRGQKENRPRWKRAVAAIDGDLGEVVGKLYVEKYFPPVAKERMIKLVQNLRVAYKNRINNLDWMSAETKVKAIEKLDKIITKIGYPDKWKDYSSYLVDRTSLVKNSMNANIFQYKESIEKLGKAVDKTEWGMTPQTVNAYYNPSINEIVFPAGIMQGVFFNMDADDAVNYGGIGAVIGHEITHGFDDQGSRYDGDGNLKNWWSPSDSTEFKSRTTKIVNQYNAFMPIPQDTTHLNGELTQGENIADLGGLSIAYDAYILSLEGKSSEVIDGFTGEQRVFYSWAQIWRAKARSETMLERIKTDPHSPGMFRANGILSNLPEFYKAFDVKEGDKMFRDDNVRVKIW